VGGGKGKIVSPGTVAPDPGLLMKADPGEEVNLYDDPSLGEVRAQMHKRLDAWNLEVGERGMATEYEATLMFPDKIGHLKMPEK
jgi:hypothetical protein